MVFDYLYIVDIMSKQPQKLDRNQARKRIAYIVHVTPELVRFSQELCCGDSVEEIMKCVICENPKSLKKKRITKKYTECGLDNVVLRSVECHKCDVCGEEYFGFNNMDQLHAEIARALIAKKGLLIGHEIRFLRTYLGYAGAVFAKLIGYRHETLSRIENHKQSSTKTLDILVRSLVANKLPDRNYKLHDMWLRESGESFKRIELRAQKDGWHVKLAA